MGVKNLFKLIKEFAPDAITAFNPAEFKGKKIFVDASIFIYQWCAVGISHHIVNKQDKYINHIQGLFFKTVGFILNGIEPVYVFDGKPPELKINTINKRKENKPIVYPNVISECKILLDIMGVSWIQANGEAECLASKLGPVCTEDSDALAFGASHIIRSDTIIDCRMAIKLLDLNYNEFVDMCIVLGTDYNNGIKNYGHKRSLTLIQKYKSIEQIIELKPEIEIPVEYKKVRQIYTSQPNKPTTITRPGYPNIDKLSDFLINQHGLEFKRVSSTLNKLKTNRDVLIHKYE